MKSYLGYVLTCAVAIGCGAGAETKSPGDGDDAGPGPTTTGVGGAGGTTDTGTGGGFFAVGGSTPGGSGCTSDLQKTVDGDGNVTEVCPPDMGCFEGVCIPACEAAAKSKGSIGCEYWTPNPPFLQNETPASSLNGSCYAVFVANTWGRHAKLQVSYDGNVMDVTQFARIPSGVSVNTQYNPLPAMGLPPGEVAVLFLSHKPGALHPIGSSMECPVPPAVQLDTAAHNSARAKAFDVTSDTPITAYDIMPYGGARSFLPSASLLFPRTAWGTNYLAMSTHNSGSGKPWALLVGSVDNTTVTVVPPTALPGGVGVSAAPANQVTQYTINAGEILQWLGADPTGAVFQSDNPVGLWAGNTYLRVPTATSPTAGGQDSAHQQIAHIGAFGHEYVGGGVVTRIASLQPESVLYRIVGIADGTTLTWDPSPPVGAPNTLSTAQVVEFETTSFFQVTSQDDAHPFALTQYMGGAIGLDRPGCSPTPPFPGITCGLGDEEWVVMIAPQQFLSRYVFFVDATYATANLVITRVKGPKGFSDVTIGCLNGPVTGWQPVGASGSYEVAHVDLYRGGIGVTPACATSQHVATSEGAFGVIVWGTDYYASYGYPAGGNIGTINDIVIIPEPE